MLAKTIPTDEEAKRLFVELGVNCDDAAISWREQYGSSMEEKIKFCMTVACAVHLVREMLDMEKSPIGEDFFHEMARMAHEWHLAGSPESTK